MQQHINNHKQPYKIYLASAILFSLSACTPPPSAIAPENETKSFASRKLELKDLKSWTIKGGMAVKEGRQGFSATLLWQQRGPNKYSIQLTGPLGSGKVKLTNRAGMATLADGNKHFKSNSPEALLRKHTGYTIPVDSLFYWVRGLPSANASSSKKIDAYGHLSQLNQQGWTILYKRFTAFKGLDVPSKIFLIKGQIKVKLIINQWQ